MRAILTKRLAPTDTKGCRIKAYDCDGNQITIPYDYLGMEECHKKAAYALLEKMHWGGELISGWTKGGMAHVFKH